VEIIAIAISIASLVCWILTLVKIFQSGNTLWGILGICPLVAFIYGWVKVGELDNQKIMLIWTVCIIAGMIVNFSLAATGQVPAR
jgi:hypothetical protein